MILLLLDCPLGERCVNSQVSVLVSVRPLFNLMSDEDGRGDSESLGQAADLANIEVAFARENFRHDSLAPDLR